MRLEAEGPPHLWQNHDGSGGPGNTLPFRNNMANLTGEIDEQNPLTLARVDSESMAGPHGTRRMFGSEILILPSSAR